MFHRLHTGHSHQHTGTVNGILQALVVGQSRAEGGLVGGQKLTGYNVTNQLNVIIRDMEHIGATLDKATAAGANTIYNIQFLSTKADAAMDEATAYAVQDAMRRAELLANAAGLQLAGKG